MKRYFAFVLTAAFLGISARAQVVINEIMQSNVDCIMDDLNDFPDSWVELYNAGSEAVNLSEYSLGDTEDAAAAWSLPKEQLKAGGYKIVYCDKAATGWHTAFRLESGKECALFLFKNGMMTDRLPSGMKKQPAPNIAYGRQSDGREEWGYQLTPTPGTANCGEICSEKDMLGAPVFSIPGGLYDERQYLTLSLPEGTPENTEIRYTNDGSEPTAQSKLYSGQITVEKTMVVRAKLFCKGYLSPRSLTHTYIFLDREVTLPIVSVCTDKRFLTDSKIGIYVEGSYGNKKNYEYNWRRPINFEYFENGISILNQICETRITGGASRSAALKSLGVYANKRFGEKRLKHEFFPDQRPGITDFKSIMLRNAGNDFDYLYMRDAVIQRLMSTYCDLDWQAWQPAIFLLNGEYKGILNIRERSNEDNIYTNYDGLEDIDMVENWGELKEGNINSWNEFKAFYNEHGHTWDEYNERLDVQEFMDIMIMNLFFCNLDFPGNNLIIWRPQTPSGRWRVVAKDTDFGLGLYGRDVDYKIFQWLYNPNYDSNNNWGANGYEGTRLFRRLMEDSRFYREFIDRFAIYMGDFLNYDRTWEIWQPMYETISKEYPIHRALYNRWWPNYGEELSNAQSWLKKRVEKIYNQINSYYKVGTPKPLSINVNMDKEELEKIAINFNDVKLSRGTFNGMFFAGRNITLQGENIAGWEVTEVYSNGPVIKTIDGSTYSFSIPSNCTAITMKTKLIAPASINSTCYDDNKSETIYDLSGTRRTTLTKGVNIVRSKGTTRKILVR